MFFKLAFLSSSDFTIPILENILESENQSLQEVLDRQIFFLEENQVKINHKLSLSKIKNNLLKIPAEILTRKPKLELIITQPDRKNRQKLISNPISKFAKNNNLNLFQPIKINQEYENIEPSLNLLDMAITASFGQIISSKVLKLPKFNFINWHPSLLPKYRGASPMQAIIANGEKISGLSWIEMTAKMDAGEILFQTQQNLKENVDFNGLAQEMAEIGKNTWLIAVLSQILKKVWSDYKISQPQNDSEATFTSLLKKEFGLVDPAEMTAEQIYNHYNAYQVFPKTSILEVEKFKQKLRLEEVYIFTQSLKDCIVLYENPQMLQIRQGKNLKTLLKCKGDTYLEVKKVVTEQGKKIDFVGLEMGSR